MGKIKIDGDGIVKFDANLIFLGKGAKIELESGDMLRGNVILIEEEKNKKNETQARILMPEDTDSVEFSHNFIDFITSNQVKDLYKIAKQHNQFLNK